MCGIIGYTGAEDAVPKIVKGLSVLEYRGYDSAGTAVQTEQGIVISKCQGRVTVLREQIERENLCGSCAIGHTRWATHGGPSHKNAHPHRVGQVVLVHNGIIENYESLKSSLEEQGYSFFSDTDTEVAAALIEQCYRETGEPVAAIRMATSKILGSYAFGILFEEQEQSIYAVRHSAPLLLGQDEKGAYLASDLTALLPFTSSYHRLQESSIACLTPSGVVLFDRDGNPHPPVFYKSELSASAAQKDGYAHFMLKEMMEQPRAISQTLAPRIHQGLPFFECDGLPSDFWKSFSSVELVACGSAMHACLVGAHFLQEYAAIPCEVHIASEYRYGKRLKGADTLVVLVSQSGETADTLAALMAAKERGQTTLAIVNTVESAIVREADRCIYTYAGPEIAVATTKGYCTQAALLVLLSLDASRARGQLTDAQVKEHTKALSLEAPQAMERLLQAPWQIFSLSEQLTSCSHLFYIGRGLDYALAQEGSLKLKEISYLHCQAYAAGELKHGTISLVQEGTPVIALCVDEALFGKTESNIQEVLSRGADVIFIGQKDLCSRLSPQVSTVPLDGTSKLATLFQALAAMQMLAYRTALLLGCDIDCPRNLAKSVTVE